MAALGSRHDESSFRLVRYKTAKGDVVVEFTGGIICISNLPLDGHHHDILSALNDRVFVINFEPSDAQIIALIEELASQGVAGVTPKKCQMVCRFLINECMVRDIRPTVRLFVDKAINDFRLHQMGASETHWKDLIVSNLEQQLVELQHPTNDLTRAEKIEAERRIALDCHLQFESRAERVEQWKDRTGKSQPAFYRRIAELKKEGLLS
jgi:hypothetical protein